MKNVMGTRVGMEHVQERPHVQLSTSHHTHVHINILTSGVIYVGCQYVLVNLMIQLVCMLTVMTYCMQLSGIITAVSACSLLVEGLCWRWLSIQVSYIHTSDQSGRLYISDDNGVN